MTTNTIAKVPTAGATTSADAITTDTTGADTAGAAAQGADNGKRAQALRRGRPPRIDREQIVTEARRIVVAEGLAALTMRRLGAALGLDPMVPYRFFATKDELLDEVFLSIVADAAPEPGPDPVANVAVGFREFRRLIAEVPGLLSVAAPRLLHTPVGAVPAAWVADQLTAAGMSRADAVAWNTLLLSYVVGSVVCLPDPSDPDSAEPFDEQIEWGFERLLTLLRSETQPG